MIRLPRPSWASVPPTVVGVEWANPITRGLVDVVVPVWGRSLVLGAVRNTTTGPLSIVNGAGPLGEARVTIGSTPVEEYGPMGAGLTTWTHLGVIRHTSLSGSRTAGCGDLNVGGFFFANNTSNFRAISNRSGANNILVGPTVDLLPAVMVHHGNPTTHTLRVRGAVTGPTSHGGIVGATDGWAIGRSSASLTNLAEHYLYAIWSRELSTDELLSLERDPWQLLQRPRRLVAVGFEVAAGTVTGASTATLGPVTGSSTGAVSLTGASTATLSPVVGSASGTVQTPIPVNGQSGAVLSPVTGTVAGSVTVQGRSTGVVGSIFGAASGTVSVRGASTITLGSVVTTPPLTVTRSVVTVPTELLTAVVPTRNNRVLVQ